MSKGSTGSSRSGNGACRAEIEDDSVTSRRERLAKLIGRLLARYWLREKRSGKERTEIRNS